MVINSENSENFESLHSERPEIAYWLALWRTEGIGPVKFSQLLEKIKKNSSIKNYVNKNLAPLSLATWKRVEQDLNWAKQPNCFIVTIEDEHYPAQLKQIHSAPPLLFVQGCLNVLSHAQIAMVGSRNPTSSGLDNAYQFAKFFASHDLTITSGLAIGIDTASHEGALSYEKGKTIAVMATGPDIIYPKRNQALARKIIEHGCLVTEFPTGVFPAAANFPRRNRLISGLSAGVLVVEAAYASGSLVTANYALEQNREVFAIPGSIQNPLARGCHALIKQGAKLVETAQDILEELEEIDCLHKKYSSLSENPENPENLENPFLNYIGFETTPIDLIIHRSGLTAEEVSSILLLLELEANIASVPGGYIRLN